MPAKVRPPCPDYVVEFATWLSSSVGACSRNYAVPAKRHVAKVTELNHALLVRSGILSIASLDQFGRKQVLALRYPNETILPFEASSAVTIEAVTNSQVEAAELKAFESSLALEPEMHSILRKIARRDQAIAFEWIARLSLKDAASRLAHLLCETYNRMPADRSVNIPKLPFSQSQLAQVVGLTPVHINRTLARLERDGLIVRRGRVFIFPDWFALERLAGFEDAYLS